MRKMLFDSHAHLDDPQFDLDRQDVIGQLKEHGVGFVVDVGADLSSSKTAIALAEQYDFIYAAAGVHPQETAEMTVQKLDELRSLLLHPKCVALGEIGLDYHYQENPPKQIQQDWLEKQVQLAEQMNKPVIIHDREAHEDCFHILKRHSVRGVFHCFSGSAEFAKELLKAGYYISFTGVVTFQNAKKAVEAVKAVPLDRLMIETDCPYMAPVPNRGKRNEPAYVRYTAEKIAQIKEIDVETVIEKTTQNAMTFYGIS